MINYPIKKTSNVSNTKYTNTASRGMALEEMINRANEYYKLHEIAYVSKRPTSIKVIKTDGENKITSGVFQCPSTLDYVGVYQGRYLDFEAKECALKKGFPLKNIEAHQITAMKEILKHGGISFAIIFMKAYNEIYLLDASFLLNIYPTQSIIPYETLTKVGKKIKEGYLLSIDYIKTVKEVYIEK